MATLNFPSDYDAPITFNRLIVSGNINYPAGYNLPITIGGSFEVKGTQFPAGYTGPITIGGDGVFDSKNILCRPGAVTGFDIGIFLPPAITALTINNAKTGGSGNLNIKLGPRENIELFVAGDSRINGYIDVSPDGALTIDSAKKPGSESGKLAITSSSNTAIGGGTITINGGTIEATGGAAGIGGDGSRITINAGRVAATCTGNGAAIGSRADSSNTVAHITINGGTVTASANGDGAGIGSGSGATGGHSSNTTSVGAIIAINGGTVTASGGDSERIYLGSGSFDGAGIGGGKGASADITITSGHVTANSMHGAGIGNGAGGGGNNPRGSIVLTGGTIRGYSMDGANIGKGNGSSWRPTYHIKPEADILMHRRGYADDEGAIVGWCDNPYGNLGAKDDHGGGHFVNLFFDEGYVLGDLYVYKADTRALVRYLPIPEKHPYASILFSTGHPYAEEFRIFVDTTNYIGVPKGMKQVVHYYAHDATGTWVFKPGVDKSKFSNAIPSVTHMNSYKHNFAGASWHVLYAALDLGGNNGSGSKTYFNVKEMFVDINGSPIPGKPDNDFFLEEGTPYHGSPDTVPGYDYKGYKQGAWDGSYAPGNLSIPSVVGNILVYYVYKKDPGTADVKVSKVVTGHFANKAKDFAFTVYIKDADNQPLTGTIAYAGGIVPGAGVGIAAPADGALALDKEGKATFILKHGQMIMLLAVPADAMIRLVETPDKDYNTSYTDSGGGDGGGDSSATNDTGFNDVGCAGGVTQREFAFCNAQKVDPVPTGIAGDLPGMAWLSLIAVIPIFLAWLAIGMVRRKLSAATAPTAPIAP
ncbi:MAG: hypothetical protein FWE59_06405 [Oscillospiraceae bacterium]|nr:hypothetical protein [Oscillospiraceae bacterium]